jgi:hypothetical protein
VADHQHALAVGIFRQQLLEVGVVRIQRQGGSARRASAGWRR